MEGVLGEPTPPLPRSQLASEPLCSPSSTYGVGGRSEEEDTSKPSSPGSASVVGEEMSDNGEGESVLLENVVGEIGC